MNHLKKVKISSEHLLTLINDVLDMSRIESGKVALDESPISVEAIFDNIVSIANGAIIGRNLEFNYNFNKEMSNLWIIGDRLRLIRIFANIISNSIKYTKDGGKINLSLKQIPCDKDGYVNIETVIEDTGIGMSKEFLEHLFEPFARAENSTISGITGTGLGLAITKSFIELMNGQIKVESELGVGTKTTINIIHKLSSEIIDTNVSIKIDKDILKDKHMLLVEDNELNREIAIEILTSEGIIVDSANDGLEAIEKVKNSKNNLYDCILMDIQMPRMNGYDATIAIRNLDDEVLKNIPIIAMTANAFEEDKQKAFDVGMNAHVSKPINIDILMKTLSDIFKFDINK